jgi:DNA-binding NarL/FixJ family response regulator
MPVRVLLTDDHPLVRVGLRTLIDAEPDLEVVGEADNGQDAIALASALMPDVIVLDIQMPRLDGLHATPLLKRVCPLAAIVVLTVYEDAAYLRELFEVGANAYVLKRAASTELIGAIRSVLRGDVYVDPRVASKVVVPVGPRSGSAPSLSEREAEVLRAVAQGYSNKEIAGQLTLSVRTVETYKARSMEKLGLRNRVDIVRYATEHRWLS